jgi:hypothetical protein
MNYQENDLQMTNEVWVLVLPYNEGHNTHVYLFPSEQSGRNFMEENNIKLWKKCYFRKKEMVG